MGPGRVRPISPPIPRARGTLTVTLLHLTLVGMHGTLAATDPIAGTMPLTFGWTRAFEWPRDAAASEAVVLVSPRITTEAPWNELVVSWNVAPAEGAGLSVEVEPLGADGAGRFYHLGHWTPAADGPIERTSVRGQRDDFAEVKTDTLVLRRPSHAFRLRLTLAGTLARHPDRLKWVTASLCDTTRPPGGRPALATAWGTVLDVPERSQVAFPQGRAWCSPTSVSMVLAWWSRQLDQPGIDRDVPEVAQGVHDPGWPGTGNWPFNTAYAGSISGLRACAARLRDLRDLEELILAGIPVVLSVNAPMLRGEAHRPDGGHLVVAAGFTDSGDVVVNDPWARISEGQRVRRVYRRDHVDAAWRTSHRLTYLIAPDQGAHVFPILGL